VKTIKPQKLGILTRCFELQRRFFLGVSTLMYIPLTEKPGLFSEAGMWKFAAGELGKDAALDAGIPKEKAEFVVAGSAYVPGGGKSVGCSVKVHFAGKQKELYVYGERFWQGSTPSEPVSFASMKVDWEHAYGGEGFDKNPLGKGFKPVKIKDMTVRLLPNVLYPNERVLSSDKHYEPASFMPVDFSWPQRMSKAGTHDDNWLKEDFPGFARDIDWTIFNIAPSDQWLDKKLTGHEGYYFQNMHPDMPIITGNLPGFVSRCFITRTTSAGEDFHEIKQKLSTVWFFPHAERAILVYQGSCEVFDEDAADVTHIIIGAENDGEEKPQQHYQEVMRLRLDKEKGPLYCLKDSDLLPAGLESVDAAVDEDKAMFEGEGLIRKNLEVRQADETEKARAKVASYGLDPDEHGPKMPDKQEPLPDLEHLPEFMDKLFKQAEEQRLLAEEGKVKSLERVEKMFEKMGMDFNMIRDEIAYKPKGPPDFSAQKQIDALKALADRIRATGSVPEEIDAYLADETFTVRLYEGEKKLKEAYRITAHHQGAAPAMDEARAMAVREAVKNAFTEGRSFELLDMTGADLKGLDLKGANFNGAFLESVDFSGANLEGCSFIKTVLAHAKLDGANLKNCNFEDANLGGASLVNVDAAGINLSEAVISKADLTDANITGACLDNADFSGAMFNGTDFSNSHAKLVTFFETDLSGLMLKGAKLDGCNFLKAGLAGVDFSGASLKSAVFLEVKGANAVFAGADMGNVRFVMKCDFTGADFSGAIMENANLRGSILDGCNFSQAVLNGSDLSECSLKKAKFYRAQAKEARFIKADLKESVLISINAMNASFQRADMRAANFSGANLFQADFARVWADADTKLIDALSAKVRVYPRKIISKEAAK